MTPINDLIEQQVSIDEVWGRKLVGFDVQKVRVLDVQFIGSSGAVVVPVIWTIVAAVGLVDDTEELGSTGGDHDPCDELRWLLFAEGGVVETQGVEAVDDDDIRVEVDASVGQHQPELSDVCSMVDVAD